MPGTGEANDGDRREVDTGGAAIHHWTVLEERMNTMQAHYEGALDRLRADIARMGEENARRSEENARRELRITLTFLGIVVAGFTILGFLIRLP